MMHAWECVDCPICNATAGQKCRTLTTNKITDTHHLRFDRAHEWHRRQRD
jgi:hypothetical protein